MLGKLAPLITLTLFFSFTIQSSIAQTDVRNGRVVQSSDQKLDWKIQTLKFNDYETLKYFSFAGAQDDLSEGGLPKYVETRKLKSNVKAFDVRLVNAVYARLAAEEAALLPDNSQIPTTIIPEGTVSKQKGQPFAIVSFVPLRRNPSSGQLEKLVSFNFEITPTSYEQYRPRTKAWAASSVLNTGEFWKIAIAEDGIYKVDYAFMEAMGIDVDSLNSDDINLFGNGFGQLPLANDAYRPDDLHINNILMVDSGDGSFDAGDYFLFYGNGPNVWSYDSALSVFSHNTHSFSDSSYYYIGIKTGNSAQRIANQNSVGGGANAFVTSFDDYQVHEQDFVNLVKSGRIWFGEAFDSNTDNRTFNFTFPDLDLSSDVRIKASVASYTPGTGNSSTFRVSANGLASADIVITGLSSGYTADVAKNQSTILTFTPNSSVVSVGLDYQWHNAECNGWLDYLEVQGRRNLSFGSNDFVKFRDVPSVAPGNVAEYTLSNAGSVQYIWEITDPTKATRILATPQGNDLVYTLTADSLREFVAFSANAYKTPSGSGFVDNQNLHATGNVDMVIVAHPEFWADADRLAQFRRDNDSLSVQLVEPQWVYNEFSGGMKDATAIKDYMRMLYERANGDPALMPRYLLLFGDGSYDNKNRLAGNTAFIPTFQSANSWSVINSYVTDDYYGLLDPTESDGASQLQDIGIGRFPVKTAVEAKGVVDKVIHYTKTGSTGAAGSHCVGGDVSTFGDWRNMIVLIGDDEDGNTHINNSEKHAQKIELYYPEMNIFKIYLDAYKQESTPGGERYPEAAEALKQRVEKGALIVNYTGHGGEVGWAHERILDVPTILGWRNLDHLALFVTATCEFSRYDDPARTSAGEYVLLNPDGGGVALLTTTRLVFSSPNFTLNDTFYTHAMSEPNGERLRFGDLCMLTKRDVPGQNSRNFSLLGDPSSMLAYPEHNVVTTQINGNPIGGQMDTLKALSQVTVTGYVEDNGGQKMTTFNGYLYPTVYDKASSITTLGQNSNSPQRTFEVTKNVIYKGKVSVVNGDFTFTFVVPKDIAYNFDVGRISYYAENGVVDANGYTHEFVVGGSADNVANDDVGPDIDLYLNDENFVSGGLTDETPTLLAKIFDENGVNTVGSGIGHDITVVLDENTDKAIVLNDFYESDLDTYKSGSVSYPFSKLDQGNHTMTFKVWDVYNNSSSTTIDFVVVESANLALDHVLNYPNPFTTNTAFYFEHNQVCEWLDVQVQVFTVGGNLVKTINNIVYTQGFKTEPIQWDGRDDFGDTLGRGVYVYRVKVSTPQGSVAEKFEKLVILK